MTALESTWPKESKLDVLLDALDSFAAASDVRWEIKKLRDYRGALLAHAPFRVGDKVMLDQPPEIERSSGWWHSRHFIVQGAAAVIREIDWRVPLDEADPAKGYWSVAAMFDKESHLSDYDEDNKRLPPDAPRREVLAAPSRRHVYHMAARRFVKR